MKGERHQGFELVRVGGVKARKSRFDGGSERREVGVVFSVDALSFGEAPESFDQIQVGGVRRQEQEPDAQLDGQPLDHLVSLVARVVQHQSDGAGRRFGGDLAKQLAQGVGVHHGGVADGDQLSRDGVPGSQNVEALAAGRGANEDPGGAPKAAEEGAEDEVSRVNEEDVAVSGLSGIKSRLKLGFQELALRGDMFGQRLFGGTGTARVRCQRKPRSLRKTRVCVKPRWRPVSCSIRSAASATVRTGDSFSAALIVSA